MKKVNFNTPIPQELHLDYHDKYIVLLDNVHQVQHTQETILNESFITMLVEEGECTAIINDNEYSLSKGDLLICTPGNVMERGMVSINFHCRIFIISSEHTGDILKGTPMSITHYLMSKVVQIIHLSQEEQETIKGFYKLFSTLNPLPEDKAREHIVHHLLKSFAYAFVGFFIQRGYASTREHRQKYFSESLCASCMSTPMAEQCSSMPTSSASPQNTSIPSASRFLEKRPVR